MCGRYTLTVDQEALEAALQVPLLFQHEPRFNVAPTQEAPVLVRDAKGRNGGQEPEHAPGDDMVRLLRWGLVPHWADEPGIGNRLINARAESVHEKPAFRTAFRRGRCLVPADGFYEWRQEAEGKVPYWIHRQDGGVFTFAGISARWFSEEEALETYAILTTDAPPSLSRIHPRVPVVVPEEERDRWLDPASSTSDLRAVLAPPAEEAFHVQRVSKRVNSPANDDPACVAAVGGDPLDLWGPDAE